MAQILSRFFVNTNPDEDVRVLEFKALRRRFFMAHVAYGSFIRLVSDTQIFVRDSLLGRVDEFYFTASKEEIESLIETMQDLGIRYEGLPSYGGFAADAVVLIVANSSFESKLRAKIEMIHPGLFAEGSYTIDQIWGLYEFARERPKFYALTKGEIKQLASIIGAYPKLSSDDVWAAAELIHETGDPNAVLYTASL